MTLAQTGLGLARTKLGLSLDSQQFTWTLFGLCTESECSPWTAWTLQTRWESVKFTDLWMTTLMSSWTWLWSLDTQTLLQFSSFYSSFIHMIHVLFTYAILLLDTCFILHSIDAAFSSSLILVSSTCSISPSYMF